MDRHPKNSNTGAASTSCTGFAGYRAQHVNADDNESSVNF
jgi:hypothetical protein